MIQHWQLLSMKTQEVMEMRVDEAIEDLLCGRAGLTRFRSGEVVFRAGDSSYALYIVRYGQLQLQRGASIVGKQPLLFVAGDMWCVGSKGAMLTELRDSTATCLEAVTVTIIGTDRLSELSDCAPGLWQAMVDHAVECQTRRNGGFPDAFGPLTQELFDPPPTKVSARMSMPSNEVEAAERPSVTESSIRVGRRPLRRIK
jgi:CRP-like cAMP-binding protein